MSHELPDFSIEELEELDTVEFERFGNEEAVELGLIAVAMIRERALNLAVDIVLGNDLVFRAKLGTTGEENNLWLAGKASVARMFGTSSLLVRRRHEAAGTPFTDLDLDHDAFKAHGGSIPLRVGGEIIGTITASGEPDVIDHEVAAAAIRQYLSR